MLEHPVGSRLAEWGGLLFFLGGVPKPAEALFRSVMGCLQSLCYLTAAVKEECGPRRWLSRERACCASVSAWAWCSNLTERPGGHGFNSTRGNAETRYLEFTSQSKQTTS